MLVEAGEVVGNELGRVVIVTWWQGLGVRKFDAEVRDIVVLCRIEAKLEPLVTRLFLGDAKAPFDLIIFVDKLGRDFVLSLTFK